MQTNPQSPSPQDLQQRPAPAQTSPTPGLTPPAGPPQSTFTPTPRPALLPSNYSTPAFDPQASPEAHAHRPEIPRPIVLPPKPKPGRKAATDVPEDKRKASNRDAQRRFREKRRKKIQELQEQVEAERQARIRDQATTYQQMHEYEETKRQLHALQHEKHPPALPPLDRESQTPKPFHAPPRPSSKFPLRTAPDWSPEARKEIKTTLNNFQMPLSLKTSQQSRGSRGSQASSSATTTTPSSATTLSGISPGTIPDFAQRRMPSHPEAENPSSRGVKREHPDNDHEARPHRSLPPPPGMADPLEVDYTNLGRFAPTGSGAGPDCGFCYDPSQYCLCAAMSKKDNMPMPTPPPDASFSSRFALLEPPVAAGGAPGECDSCRKDPEQRRICMDMARNTFSGSDTRSSSAQPSASNERSPPTSAELRSFRVPSARYMACNSAVSWVRREVPSLTRQPWYQDVIQNVRVTRPHGESECVSSRQNDSTDEEHHSHAQDVEVASILTLLGNAKSGRENGHNDSGYGTFHPGPDDDSKAEVLDDHQHNSG